MENKNQISFEKFLFVVKKRIIWILIIALVAGLAAGVVTKLLVKPEYVSYATFYVQSNEQQTNITQQQIQAAKSLVDTYIVFLRGNDFLEDVAKTAEVDYSYSQIRARMTASAVNSTEVFKVSISDNDPKTAYMIATVLSNKAPALIEGISGGKVSVIDKPQMPVEPNSTGTKRNAVLGAALGAIIAFAAFFVKEILDVTIYSEEDITEEFKYPVIGTIPTIVAQQEEDKKRSRSKNKEGSGEDGKNGEREAE